MTQKEFDELIASVSDGGRILRGEAKASREFTITPCVPKTKTVKKVPRRR